MKLYLTCLCILHRWHIVAAFWGGAASRVGTRQERRRTCHFTLGGNPSRVTIVQNNRQEMVKHIILTRWALWHGQFHCCHRWRKEGNSFSRYSERGEIKMLSSFSVCLLCVFASPCLCVWVCQAGPGPGRVSWVTMAMRRQPLKLEFGVWAYLLSCLELDEKICTTFITVWYKWCFCQQLVSLA